MALRQYEGGAKPTTVDGDFNAAATSFNVADATGWPDGSEGPFSVVVNRTGATAEKMLATARTGMIPATITVPLANRGYDDTAAAQHFTGEVVEHVATAEDMRDANAHIFDSTTTAHVQHIHVNPNGTTKSNRITPAGTATRNLELLKLTGQTAAFLVALEVDGTTVLFEVEPDGDLIARTLRALANNTSDLVVLDKDNALNRRARVKFRQQGVDRWEVGVDRDSTNAQNFYIEDNNGADANDARLFIDALGNIGLLGVTSDFGGGSRVVALLDSTSAPTSNPTTGSLLYSESTVLRIRDAEGVLTPIGREFFDGKGELLVGLADNSFDNLAAPTTGQALTGDTTATLGVAWASGLELAAWTDLTPTINQGSSIATSSLTARLTVVGKLATVSVTATMSAAGTGGNSITIGNLPAALSASGLRVVGTMYFVDTGTTRYTGVAKQPSTTSVDFVVSGNNNVLGIAPAVTIASGDTISVLLTYELA